ncbi:O-antigen ligase [Lederbergia wuyishanensis]|uniref:O-antigen ligase n=1 Tax=Lederbergia wuyishanensis TaxID=1347903 RepID=A0ABU0D352_9BACI|nr:O-antigen ligase family protein [Lederbergia wuyishanensis]MDQ0342834.1 O-antigen ligase [Lederbergia wuyishanensis]
MEENKLKFILNTIKFTALAKALFFLVNELFHINLGYLTLIASGIPSYIFISGFIIFVWDFFDKDRSTADKLLTLLIVLLLFFYTYIGDARKFLIIELAMMFGIYVINFKNMKRYQIITAPILLLVSLAWLYINYSEAFLKYVQLFKGQAETVVLRKQLFEVAFQEILKNPWIGKGIDSGINVVTFHGRTVEQSVHNVFINYWYTQGFFGFLIITIILLIPFFVKVKHTSDMIFFKYTSNFGILLWLGCIGVLFNTPGAIYRSIYLIFIISYFIKQYRYSSNLCSTDSIVNNT